MRFVNITSYFCENDILGVFANVMRRSKFKENTIEIIQSVSILLSNVNVRANLNYLLSNPHINEFIIYYYNFTDEEIVEYYVSMLKSISLRMDSENISLFYNEVCLSICSLAIKLLSCTVVGSSIL
jgi:protein CLEC16A